MTAMSRTGNVWPSLDDYALARPCPSCQAPHGTECTWRMRRNGRFHSARYTAGIRHYHRDVEAAPWTEDREPGRCYCTIEPCPFCDLGV